MYTFPQGNQETLSKKYFFSLSQYVKILVYTSCSKQLIIIIVKQL
jgi:hypothetical protein